LEGLAARIDKCLCHQPCETGNRAGRADNSHNLRVRIASYSRSERTGHSTFPFWWQGCCTRRCCRRRLLGGAHILSPRGPHAEGPYPASPEARRQPVGWSPYPAPLWRKAGKYPGNRSELTPDAEGHGALLLGLARRPVGRSPYPAPSGEMPENVQGIAASSRQTQRAHSPSPLGVARRPVGREAISRLSWRAPAGLLGRARSASPSGQPLISGAAAILPPAVPAQIPARLPGSLPLAQTHSLPLDPPPPQLSPHPAKGEFARPRFQNTFVV